MNPFGPELLAFLNRSATSSGNYMASWPEYLTDALQRSVLFLELLRQRGNEEVEITSRPMATVLSFGHEILMSGRSLPRPINYALSRIVPPPGVVIDPHKRPVVVVDPRAGQGSGIGGFKAESEIGDALRAGHPVYFIGFSATPAPGQQFLDVVEGQVKFFERVIELHPDAPRPFAIGNCQAGYQTLMVAMLRPDLFGPCLVAARRCRTGRVCTEGLSAPRWLTRKNVWQGRYRSIVDLENHLYRNGTVIIKFFLHLSAEEQRKRFLERIDDPDKNWKFSVADIQERKFWDQYTKVYGECLVRRAQPTRHGTPFPPMTRTTRG